MENERILKERLEAAKTENLNLRFDKVESELTDVKTELIDIKTLIKEYVTESRTNREEYLRGQQALNDRISSLEETRRNCPVKILKAELARYGKETSFVRGIFKNAWKGIVVLTVWIIIINTLVLLFGPNSIFELILKLKGL